MVKLLTTSILSFNYIEGVLCIGRPFSSWSDIEPGVANSVLMPVSTVIFGHTAKFYVCHNICLPSYSPTAVSRFSPSEINSALQVIDHETEVLDGIASLCEEVVMCVQHLADINLNSSYDRLIDACSSCCCEMLNFKSRGECSGLKQLSNSSRLGEKFDHIHGLVPRLL